MEQSHYEDLKRVERLKNEAKKDRRRTIYILIIVGLVGIFLIYLPDNSNKSSLSPKEEAISKQFSAWDGSHIKLERYIKERMNDPDSYEHIETRYSDNLDHLLIVTKFRGRNAFGAKVISTVTAKVKIYTGDVIEIVKQ